MDIYLLRLPFIFYKISSKKYKAGESTLDKLSNQADRDLSPPFLDISMIYIIFKD